MFTSQSCVFAVNYHARAIAPQKSSKERHRFLVGTCSLQESNELSVLEYHESSNQIEATAVYNHPDQIWSIEPSPNDPDLLITSSQSTKGDRNLTLWRMPHQSADDLIESTSPIEDKLELVKESSFILAEGTKLIQDVKWHPNHNKILTADSNRISLWSIDSSKIEATSTLNLSRNESVVVGDLTCGATSWDPNSSTSCVAAYGSSLNFVDTRKMIVTQEVPDAHRGAIRDVEYNPNKPSILVSCGDDRLVKFWDVRNLSSPLRTLSGHSHFVWCTRFNPFHDQLLLSGGSDNILNLWRVASCSSAPWIGADESGEGDETDPPDIKVRVIDQHEDSIYSAAWSPADAWMYCSLSYDGTVILNHVPSTEKYKILL